MDTKTCTCCLVTKFFEEFPFKDKTQKKRRSICKACHNERNKATLRGETFRPSPKPDNVVRAPRMNVWERDVYVPPKWGR
jgi:superfamily II helicase